MQVLFTKHSPLSLISLVLSLHACPCDGREGLGGNLPLRLSPRASLLGVGSLLHPLQRAAPWRSCPGVGFVPQVGAGMEGCRGPRRCFLESAIGTGLGLWGLCSLRWTESFPSWFSLFTPWWWPVGTPASSRTLRQWTSGFMLPPTGLSHPLPGTQCCRWARECPSWAMSSLGATGFPLV